MTDFTRNFDVDRATTVLPRWWNDLLRLWRPAGVPAEADGLRLAIRGDYLNFYRKGASIAEVTFPSRGQPFMALSRKYVYAELRTASKTGTVRVADDVPEDSERIIKYPDIDALRGWIKNVDDAHIRPEKRQIDALLDASPDVIDLEMTFTDPSKQSIDIVCMEEQGDGVGLAFWEAKRTKGEKRVRVDGSVNPPHVIKQIGGYRSYLRSPGTARRLANEYRRVARMLIQLRSYADTLGPAYPLGVNIVAAASATSITVDREPRLVMFLDKTDTTWGTLHAHKLVKAGIPMAQVFPPVRLERSLLG